MMRLTSLRARQKRLHRWLVCGAFLFCYGFVSTPVCAQTPAAFVPLGEIVGDQVSVVGPSHAIANGSARAIQFGSGDAIVVFAGKARIEFAGGGELDICGPAKFTVLASGQALTIALNFGRVHVRFDALRPISVYTAQVIATPVSLGDRPRDATVGLTNTGTMCVLAGQGAVRLQNQLSGETVIVPEPSEVLVPSASFTSLPPATGQCRCDFDEPAPQSTTPLPPVNAFPPPAAAPKEQAVPLPQVPKASATQTSPTSPPQSSSQVSNAGAQPILKATLPPIGYDTKSPTETAEPISVATLELAQETVVQPAWIIHGTLVASGKTQDASPPAHAPANASTHKKRGFWAKLHHFFTGSS